MENNGPPNSSEEEDFEIYDSSGEEKFEIDEDELARIMLNNDPSCSDEQTSPKEDSKLYDLMVASEKEKEKKEKEKERKKELSERKAQEERYRKYQKTNCSELLEPNDNNNKTNKTGSKRKRTQTGQVCYKDESSSKELKLAIAESLLVQKNSEQEDIKRAIAESLQFTEDSEQKDIKRAIDESLQFTKNSEQEEIEQAITLSRLENPTWEDFCHGFEKKLSKNLKSSSEDDEDETMLDSKEVSESDKQNMRDLQILEMYRQLPPEYVKVLLEFNKKVGRLLHPTHDYQIIGSLSETNDLEKRYKDSYYNFRNIIIELIFHKISQKNIRNLTQSNFQDKNKKCVFVRNIMQTLYVNNLDNYVEITNHVIGICKYFFEQNPLENEEKFFENCITERKTISDTIYNINQQIKNEDLEKDTIINFIDSIQTMLKIPNVSLENVCDFLNENLKIIILDPNPDIICWQDFKKLSKQKEESEEKEFEEKKSKKIKEKNKIIQELNQIKSGIKQKGTSKQPNLF
jgi:hypothetical protein